jgi:hypothetical protein
MTTSRRTRGVVLVGLLVTLLIAGFGSYYASSSPDGLARVAIDKGLDKGPGMGQNKNPGNGAQVSSVGDSPLAGYSVRGVGSQRLAGGLAGVAGVGLTFLLVGAITVGVRRRGTDSEPGERPAGASTGPPTGTPGARS